MPEIKVDKPPQTEILSETRRGVAPGEPQPSPNEGLAGSPESEGRPVPEGQEQQVGTETPPAFTVDEEGEPTGDALEDTKQAYHAAREEVSQLKKVLAAVVADKQMNTQPGLVTPPPPPPEISSMEPTDDERADPTQYTKRMMKMQEVNSQYERTMYEMDNFVDNHTDWQDVYPTMLQIRNEEPRSFQGPGALNRLYRRAKEREELQGYRAALKDQTGKAFTAGANMQKAKGGRAFVAPSGAGGKKSTDIMPPNLSTPQMLQWLKEHNLCGEDIQ